MIKRFFGKTRADGGFDMRFKSNKGGWLGKLGRSSVGSGVKKAVGEGLSELGNEIGANLAPVIVDFTKDNAWMSAKNSPNKYLNEFIVELPSTETEKEKKVIEYIDQTFEKSASRFKRLLNQSEGVNVKPEGYKIELYFSMMNDLFWVNKRLFGENAVSKDLTNYRWNIKRHLNRTGSVKSSVLKLFDSAKENRRLKESAMKYYNSKSDQLFEDLFIEILEIFGNDERVGSEYKKKYIEYEKARFEITLLNHSYFLIPKIWIKRVLNIEEEE